MAEGVTTSVVGGVVDSLFGVTKRELSYMWNYNKYVENLKNVLQNLKDTKERVQQQIDLANNKGDNLLVGVEQWVVAINREISTAETFLEEESNAKKTCFNLRLCSNWVTLYRYGKKVTQMTTSLKQHQEGGMTFESSVSVETRAPGPLDVYQNKNLDDINTHKSALEKVLTAIEDESIQIIGIYGLGGVGKTTLAKEVASKMKNHFSEVAFTTVSQTVSVDKVQKDTENATKQIMQGKKILIILDDVWEKLNLEELCIPYGSERMNCKILLTSRSEDVCNKMNVQRKICVDPLKKDETWILFKKVVGERMETDDTLKQVAMKVAEECGGLPLFVQAIGNALKDKSIDVWKSSLNQLKKHAPLDIDSDIEKAYTHLKLSYDHLHSEEAKSCFLMCSMYAEDQLISVEDLAYFRVGLEKVNGIESVNDARDKIRSAVNILTSSGLLLNEGSQLLTKMHDVVRDVALIIASEGNNKFLVDAGKGMSEWLPRKDSLESYTGISLMCNKICKLPDYELHLPHLNTLLIYQNNLSKISDEFFRGMKEVRVLDMSWNEISSLPQSLKLLTKLRMLDLRGNRFLDEISILGELKDLEILILSKTGITEIPKEIGQLVNLRLFDVNQCEHLCHISPGVLSKLCWLEELCIGFYSMQDGQIYDRLVEVTKLSKLTYLELQVPCSDVIPKGFSWGKSSGFYIEIGRYNIYNTFQSVSERHLFLENDQNIENINMNNILRDLNHKGFNKLEVIVLNRCGNIRCLVDWDEFDSHIGDEEGKMYFMKLKHLKLFNLNNLEVGWKCPDEYISHFSDLVTLAIDNCKKLVRLFSVSVAQGLVSLQNLTISWCDGLEEVIWGDETDKIIVFPSLANISLSYLKSLESFCTGNSTIKYPSLVKVKIRYCFRMKKWGNGIQETPNLKSVNSIGDKVPLDRPYAINDAVMKIFIKDRKEDEDEDEEVAISTQVHIEKQKVE